MSGRARRKPPEMGGRGGVTCDESKKWGVACGENGCVRHCLGELGAKGELVDFVLEGLDDSTELA